MKTLLLPFFLFMILVSGCKKTGEHTFADDQQLSPNNDAFKSGSGGGSGGGGNTSGFLQGILSGTASRLISGTTDSILVTFTQQAPAGWTLLIASSNPSAAQVPSSFAVPVGVRGVYVPVTGGPISNAVSVTITVKLFSQSKTTAIKVFPLEAAFPPPSLQSPGNGANFKLRTFVTFDWNDNNNAYLHNFQLSTEPAFATPYFDFQTPESIWGASEFSGTGIKYWRVRYVAAGGSFGPWSEIRSFEVKPQ